MVQIPTSFEKVSGDGQAAETGEPLPAPLVVSVTDQGGTGIPALAVVWAITSGGGQLENAASETDANGQASAGWRMGEEAGGQTVSATSDGLEALTFSAVAAGAGGSVSVVTTSLPTANVGAGY